MLNDVLAAFCLQSDRRRKEWIYNHCPSLKSAAEPIHSQGRVTNRNRHMEERTQTTNGEELYREHLEIENDLDRVIVLSPLDKPRGFEVPRRPNLNHPLPSPTPPL